MSDEGRVVGFRGEPARVVVEPYEPELQRKRSWRRLALYGLAGLLALLLLDAAYVGWRLATSLPAAAEHLQRARRTAEALDVAATEQALSAALVEAGAATSATSHPAFRLAGLVPVIGQDAGVVDRLAEAGELSARAGLALTRALGRVAPGADSLAGALYSDGRVSFAALDKLSPALDEASVLLQEAQRLVDGAPSAHLGQVTGALLRARAAIPPVASSARRAATVLDILPGLLGRQGPKDYLLMFLSLSEQRGAGGFPGLYAVLRARDGRLELGEVRSISELRTDDRITVPSWFRGAYGRHGAVDDARQTGFSPNFPVVADAWLEIYQAVTGEGLDGVVAMDAVAFAELTEATGPITAPGLDVAVGPDNAVDVLMRDVYVRFSSPEAQNDYLGALIESFWARLGSGEVDAAALGRALSRITLAGHFKVTSTDAAADEALASLGTTWDYTRLGPNVQIVFHNNAGANKIDYFLRREIDTRVEIQDNGYVLVETRVTLENKAPAEGPASLLLGPGIEGDEPGVNGMLLHFLLPEGAVFESYSVDGIEDVPAFDDEDGRPLLTDALEVGAGERKIASLSYYLSEEPLELAAESGLTFSLMPQVAAVPDRYSVTVEAPMGWLLQAPGAAGPAEVLTRSGALKFPLVLELELVRER